jgi:hypothetical protein
MGSWKAMESLDISLGNGAYQLEDIAMHLLDLDSCQVMGEFMLSRTASTTSSIIYERTTVLCGHSTLSMLASHTLPFNTSSRTYRISRLRPPRRLSTAARQR